MEQELNFRRTTEEEAEDMIIRYSNIIPSTRNDQSQRGRRCSDDDQQQLQITYHCRKALPPKSRANNLSRPLSVFQLCINNRSFIPHLLFILFLTYLATSSPVDAVHIKSISGQQAFRAGAPAAASVVLDCDFAYADNDSMVIIKWFLNEEKEPLFQWITARKGPPTFAEKLRPFVDENFVVAGDERTRHRALRLLNPPPSLSGRYTCSVIALESEDSKSTSLVIYEPATAFDIAAVEVDEDSSSSSSSSSSSEDEGFNITCTAIGVYPEPEIRLYKVRPQSSSSNEHEQADSGSSSSNGDLESTEVESNGTTVLSFQSLTGGLYSITLVSHIEHVAANQSSNNSNNNNSASSSKLELGRAVDLPPSRERLVLGNRNRTTVTTTTPRPPKANIAEHYECRLTIPNTDYVEVRRLAIQEGWRRKYRARGAAGGAAAYSRPSMGHFAVTATVTFLLTGCLFS